MKTKFSGICVLFKFYNVLLSNSLIIFKFVHSWQNTFRRLINVFRLFKVLGSKILNYKAINESKSYVIIEQILVLRAVSNMITKNGSNNISRINCIALCRMLRTDCTFISMIWAIVSKSRFSKKRK